MPPKKRNERLASIVATVPEDLLLKAVKRAGEENMSTHNFVNPIVAKALEDALELG